MSITQHNCCPVIIFIIVVVILTRDQCAEFIKGKEC